MRALLLLAALLALPRAALAVDMIPEERVAILGVYEMECAPLKRGSSLCLRSSQKASMATGLPFS